MLKIYNTLTKKKEEFKPINPPEVKMYTCGPTVYDYFHIGNARSFIMSDIIRRYLEFRGYKVKFVLNITDVDDKIIRKANEESLKPSDVAKKYMTAFMEDIFKLKIKSADVFPKATEHIYDIISMIKSLERKGFAYNVEGNVFYDVAKFKDYGKLSGKKIEELEAGSRVEVNIEKHNPLDFALWKKAKEGEPNWESPWGKGRPGWHIECSAMSCKHLGETFDIHAGGNDLIFPHHENEIAQSEAANDKPFVNYWIHFGFLNINEEKMSKSLGNFFTARDILKQFSAESVRYLFAQSHYGGPLNFTEELLSSAEKGLEKIKNLSEKIEEELKQNRTNGKEQQFDFEKFENDFRIEMDDDFNTPRAAAVIFDFIKEVNRVISENDNINTAFYLKVKNYLNKTAGNVLGIIPAVKSDLELSEEAAVNLSKLAEEINPEEFNNLANKSPENLIEFLIIERLNARKSKDFSLSDKIRDEMTKNGIVLQDSKDKTTYKLAK